ncbi:MAG: phosphatase PAP2 family protein [Lachnospiraceae bacterium]|nr:phosphatase PAP2 family protein [Lachnospiraceae bacterium]
MEGTSFYFEWEVKLIEWLQTYIGNFGVKLSSFFSLFGEETLILLVFFTMYWCVNKQAAKIMGTNLLIALVLNPFIKNLVLRRRPYMDNAGIQCLKPVTSDADIYDISAQGYSFPSAHSLNSCVMYGSLTTVWKNKAFKIAMFGLVFFVGFSRITVGVHYPTDVLVGWTLGLIILLVVPFIYNKVNNKNIFRIIVFAISCIGVIFCRTEDYFTGLGAMAGFFMAIPFEEKYVPFKETRHPVACVLRVAGGLGLYFLINTLLKLPFSKGFLANGTLPALLVRAARYMIIIFILFAIYPIAFIKVDKMMHKEGKKSKD